MRARTLLPLLPLAFAIASTTTVAQDADQSGFYVGLSVGQSKVKFDDNEVPNITGSTSTVSKDERDTGFKIYVGHRFNRNFALEGGWADLGSFRATRNFTAPVVGTFTAEIESSGVFIDAIGILPIQQFSLFGKAGLMYATTESSFSTTGGVALSPGVNRNPKESEVEFKLGLGASYAVTRSLAIRAEFERHFEVGTSETGEGDVDLISLGVTFRF